TGCLRCLSGCVWRGLIHWQGHLRCGCVRTLTPWPAAGQSDSQPRSSGGLLRARGTAKRCTVIRGIFIALQRGCQPAATFASCRLADRTVDAAARARPRPQIPEESDFNVVALEDI